MESHVPESWPTLTSKGSLKVQSPEGMGESFPDQDLGNRMDGFLSMAIIIIIVIRISTSISISVSISISISIVFYLYV